MAAEKTPFRRRLGAWAVRRLVETAGPRLHPRRNAVLADLLAAAACPLMRRERTFVRDNLRIAFPAGCPFPFPSFFRSLVSSFGRAALDLVYASHHWPAALHSLFDGDALSSALDAVARAHALRNGLIVVTAHIGSWELLGAVLALRFNTRAVARHIYYEPYDAALMNLRSRLGYGVFYQEDPVRGMASFVRDGGLLGLVPDQDISHNAGIFVPFFGRDAYTPVGPAALSLLARVPILPVFCVRHAGAYRLVVDELILPPPRRTDDTISLLTASWQKAVEAAVRRFPGQWAWFHRRWKTLPEHVAKGSG
ncbi:MAG: lysophospholipid acyltransferase family protein [Planctomycetes bacterium]|nr:lysophospholipid acyltransferase family protein [Planctomycetota bacterium]